MDFELFNQALDMAARAHSGQFRKATPVPYITHPVAVAGLVAEYGGSLDCQIAGLLHDVLEDAGPHWAQEIRASFGQAVLDLVEACTDGLPDASGAKAPWRDRKTTYLVRLAEENPEALLVSACDKLANLRSIRHDVENHGAEVFTRFKAGQEGTLWYYQALLKIFIARDCPLALAIGRELTALGLLLEQENRG